MDKRDKLDQKNMMAKEMDNRTEILTDNKTEFQEEIGNKTEEKTEDKTEIKSRDKTPKKTEKKTEKKTKKKIEKETEIKVERESQIEPGIVDPAEESAEDLAERVTVNTDKNWRETWGKKYPKEIRDFIQYELPQMVKDRLQDLPVQEISAEELLKNNGKTVTSLRLILVGSDMAPCIYLEPYFPSEISKIVTSYRRAAEKAADPAEKSGELIQSAQSDQSDQSDQSARSDQSDQIYQIEQIEQIEQIDKSEQSGQSEHSRHSENAERSEQSAFTDVPEKLTEDWDRLWSCMADRMASDFRYIAAVIDPKPQGVFEEDQISEHLILGLINLEKNRTLLENCPYREYLDLAAILQWEVSCGERRGLVQVTNDVLERWGRSFEELYALALDTTARKYPERLTPLNDILMEYSGCIGLPESPFYFFGTYHGLHGAVSLLYPGVARKMYELMGEAYYLIPSSINELLALPVSFEPDTEQLRNLIGLVNAELLDRDEILSDSLYVYIPEKDRFEIVDWY